MNRPSVFIIPKIAVHHFDIEYYTAFNPTLSY